MSAADFGFDGLDPWRPCSGLIECEFEGYSLDLHNYASFLGYTFRADGVLSFTWHHHDPSIGPSSPNLVVLGFVEVRALRVTQADDWDVRCSDDTHGWDYWPDGDGRADLTFLVADSQLSFTAAGVHMRLVPQDLVPDLR